MMLECRCFKMVVNGWLELMVDYWPMVNHNLELNMVDDTGELMG